MFLEKLQNEIYILSKKQELLNKKQQLLNSMKPLVFEENHNSITNIASLIFTSVLQFDKYDSFDEIVKLFNEHYDFIDELEYSKTKIMFNSLYNLYELDCSEIEEDLNDVAGNDEFAKNKVIAMFKLYNLVDPNIKDVICDIIDININKMVCTEAFKKIAAQLSIKKNRYKKEEEYYISSFIDSKFDINEIKEQLTSALNFKKSLAIQIRENNKKLQKMLELEKKIMEASNKEEIANIDELLNLTPEMFKYDVLKFIAEHNKKYYIKLQNEYEYKKANSKAKYINIFNKHGIDISLISDENKNNLFNIPFEIVEKIIKFLDRIGVNINLDYVLLINISYINEFSKYLEQGIITKRFLADNIELLIDSNKNKASKYDLFINNLKLLTDYINIKNVTENSLNIYLCDTNLLIKNINILNKNKIKFNNLKDYSFLLDVNLEEKIIGLKNLSINIQNNIEILYADIDILKRIKVCEILKMSIFDKNSKIYEEVISKDKFSMTPDEVDEFIIMHEKSSILKKKIENL